MDVTTAVIDQILAEAPGLSQIKVRVDKPTQKASVIDVIRMVTGKDNNRAGESLRNLDPKFHENIVKLRINGKGQEPRGIRFETKRIMFIFHRIEQTKLQTMGRGPSSRTS